jgi:hypothetical protein
MREFVDTSNKEFNIALRIALHIPILVNYVVQTNYSGRNKFIKEFKDVAKSYWKRDDTSKLDNVKLLEIFTTKFNNNCKTSNEYYSIFITIFCDMDPSMRDWLTGRVYLERTWPGGRDSETREFTICEINENEETHPDIMESMLDARFGWRQFDFFSDPITGEIYEKNANQRSSITKFPKVLTFTFVTGHNKSITPILFYDDQQYDVLCAATKEHVIFRHKDQWYKDGKKYNYNGTDNYTIVVYTPKTPSS